jgi:hypothetical protein
VLNGWANAEEMEWVELAAHWKAFNMEAYDAGRWHMPICPYAHMSLFILYLISYILYLVSMTYTHMTHTHIHTYTHTHIHTYIYTPQLQRAA